MPLARSWPSDLYLPVLASSEHFVPANYTCLKSLVSSCKTSLESCQVTSFVVALLCCGRLLKVSWAVFVMEFVTFVGLAWQFGRSQLLKQQVPKSAIFAEMHKRHKATHVLPADQTLLPLSGWGALCLVPGGRVPIAIKLARKLVCMEIPVHPLL